MKMGSKSAGGKGGSRRGDVMQALGEAVAAHQAENFFKARKLYEIVISEDASNVHALHYFGILEAQQKNVAKALRLFDRALMISPNEADILADKGKVLAEAGQQHDALRSFEQAVSINPEHWMALQNQGATLLALRRPAEALTTFDRLLVVMRNHPPAFNNRGLALKDLGRYEEAIESFRKASSFNPKDVEVLTNLGDCLFKLKAYKEALAYYYQALEIKPDLAEALLGRGNVACQLMRYDDALVSYESAIELKPELAEAWLGRGTVLCEFKAFNEALVAFDKSLSFKPGMAEGWHGRGNVFFELKRYEEAFAAYDKAFTLNPDLSATEGARLHAKMHMCDWIDHESECSRLIASVINKKVSTSPFALFSIPSSAEDQLQCAKLWAAEKFPAVHTPVWQGERYKHDRIRVAYVSADFRDHPVSLLAAGLFESHDASRFEVTGISVGPDDNSETGRRVRSSFETFIDARNYSDLKITELVKSAEIDIFIDLMGFTAGGRPNIFAQRAAPIQVNYLGYPGTMGASYIDYIIADRCIVSKNQKEFYAEKVVYLPDSFMANDSKRKISDRIPSRAECGLPEAGFVFCSFNQSYKISPDVFATWMQLLNAVDGSVLWLLSTNETATRNLRTTAQAHGVNPERIVFAPRVALNEDHLARQKLGDLFLDTRPFNAHSTASDALWAGLPLLTQIGATFAGRVAASLLNAVGLAELITHSNEEYMRVAIDLATNPAKLSAVKDTLVKNRRAKPLFDTERFTRHIESAYEAMHCRHQAGLPPDHIEIAN